MVEVWEGQVWLGTKWSVDNVEFRFFNVMGVSTPKVGSMHVFQVWVQEVQCARVRCVQVKHKRSAAMSSLINLEAEKESLKRYRETR